MPAASRFRMPTHRSPIRNCCCARCNTRRPLISRYGCGRRTRGSREAASRTMDRSRHVWDSPRYRCARKPSRCRPYCCLRARPARAFTCAGCRARKVSRWCGKRSNVGLKLTCDIAVHHAHLSEMDIGYFDPNCNLTPPLRSQRDRDALRAALADGTIDALCSDHTPVDDDAKQLPFGEAEPGATGVELLLPLTLKWIEETRLPLARGLARVTSDPARVLGIERRHARRRRQCRHLRVRSGTILEGRAEARSKARARTRPSPVLKSKVKCATRWSTVKSFTNRVRRPEPCVSRGVESDFAARFPKKLHESIARFFRAAALRGVQAGIRDACGRRAAGGEPRAGR